MLESHPKPEKTMNKTIKCAVAAAAIGMTAQAFAQVTFYEADGWRGRAFTANGQVRDLSRNGFNDRASSVVVERGQWEVCEDANFRGQCMILRKGSYETLGGMGLNNRISSVRPVKARDRYDNEAPPPLAQPSYEWRRRPSERIVDVPVSSVHAVVGAPEQRCWVERQQVNEPSRPNAGGVIAGALIGGILGHQVGGGTGRDIATAGGAVAGAAIGNNMANQNNSSSRDVRRCETVGNQKPEYWDVTYNYRGVQHRVQMSAPPGSTIAVNSKTGEPRI
jgi:uncharacterized protein YcfJ